MEILRTMPLGTFRSAFSMPVMSGSSDESVIEKKELPNRSTRGRKTNLAEDDADTEFWNQEAWKELDEQDSEITSDEFSSNAFGDSSDSDIDEDEAAEQKQERDEALENAKDTKKRSRDLEEKEPSKKKSKYVDPALIKVKKNNAATTTSTKPKKLEAASRSIEVRQSTKNSTKATIQLANSELKASRSKNAATTTTQKSEKKLSHQQMLENAVRTELENRRALATMLIIQEEKKKRLEQTDVKEELGARVIFKSSLKTGEQLIYTDSKGFPEKKTAPTPPTPLVCTVTKQPAKYRMPGSMKPFANVMAYKVIEG